MTKPSRSIYQLMVQNLTTADALYGVIFFSWWEKIKVIAKKKKSL